MDIWNIPGLIAGCAITALILSTGHWLPWVTWLGRDLNIREGCLYGTFAIGSGFTIWRLTAGDWNTPAGLLFIAAAGYRPLLRWSWSDQTGRQPSRVKYYVYWIAALWFIFAAWRIAAAGDWITPGGLLLISAAGGATVAAMYLFDAIGLEIARERRRRLTREMTAKTLGNKNGVEK